MHIALSLGLIAPPRFRRRTRQRGPLHVLGFLVARLSIFALLLACLPVMHAWLPVLMLQADGTEAGEAMGWRFTAIAVVMGASCAAMVLDPVLRWASGAVGFARAASRRAAAYWEAPDAVQGPDDVFARLLDREPVWRLSDVEGFVAYAKAADWPMRWQRLSAWSQVLRCRLDGALRAGEETLMVGGDALSVDDASARLDQVVTRLRRRR